MVGGASWISQPPQKLSMFLRGGETPQQLWVLHPFPAAPTVSGSAESGAEADLLQGLVEEACNQNRLVPSVTPPRNWLPRMLVENFKLSTV